MQLATPPVKRTVAERRKPPGGAGVGPGGGLDTPGGKGEGGRREGDGYPEGGGYVLVPFVQLYLVPLMTGAVDEERKSTQRLGMWLLKCTH